MQRIANTLRLTAKELRAIIRDVVMLVLIAYVFTVSTYMVAGAISTEVDHLAVAVIDEDQSVLSKRLTDAIQPPLFKSPDLIAADQALQAQKDGKYILVVDFPPDMQRDLMAGRSATINLNVDATAVAHAGNGAAFMQQMLGQEITRFFSPNAADSDLIDVVFRSFYNPNLTSKWFTAVMQLMNSITILTLILSGASLIREREHGTIEHVLVMPVRPPEIVVSKIAANGLVILIAAVFSLFVVVRWLLGVPVNGSVTLFVLGTAIYVVALASLGLLLATFTRNMGQYGLLVIPVIVVMILLSGGITPMESMPAFLRGLMKLISPAPHFVAFTQSVLYRGSGLDLVWPQMAAMAAMACFTFTVTLIRFRKVLAG